MKRALVVAGMLPVLMAGCAIFNPVPRLEVRSNPQVTVRDGRIALNQDVLYFRTDERNVPITWRLPQESKLRFPPNGIVIEGEVIDRVLRAQGGRAEAVALNPNQTEIVECRVLKDGLEFTCLNRNTRPGVYKYTLRVRDGDRLIERDPPIINGQW